MTIEFIPERQVFHAFVPCVMGTKLDFFICGRQESDSCTIWNEFYGKTVGLDTLLNRFDPRSEVSRINASVPFEGRSVCREIVDLLILSQEYYNKTGRIFDITLGSGDNLSIDSDKRLSMTSGQLDFGGIAKGYALRFCKELLDDCGVDSAFVNFGNSSILAVGNHPFGNGWTVEVLDPYGDRSLDTLCVRDRSISTSGNTPGYSGHILNPLTGERVTDRKVSVAVCDDPLDAEVLSTVAMACDATEFAASLNKAEYKIFEV